MEKRLERYLDEAQLGGVAAGIAHYFALDRTLVRVLFVVGLFIPALPSIIPYLILWAVLPERRTGLAQTNQSTIFSTPAFSMASTDQKRNGNLIWGAILIIIGVFALLERYTDIDISDVWPLLLIGFGAWLILRDRDQKSRTSTSYLDSDPTPPVPPTLSANDPYDPNRPVNQL